MVRIRNGVIHDVLSDRDLAEMSESANDDHTTGERSGARPYVTRDLLVPQTPRRSERSERESFFYVIYMIRCRYDKGEEKDLGASSD